MGAPFIKRARATYYLAWVPMTALVVMVMAYGGLPPWLAAAVTIPLCALYAVVCDSAYYLARAWPVRRVHLIKLIVNHLAATAIAGGIFTGLFYVASLILGAPENAILKNQLETVFAIGTAYFVLSVFFHYLVVAIINTNRAERSAAEAETQKRHAELKALRAQLNPHFLFNSLNSIAALTVSEPEEARRMCQLLSDFLRATTNVADLKTLTLDAEVEVIKKYLEIEKVRFGERVNLEVDVKERCGEIEVPAMLLQPLVENAVKHGIAELESGGTIRISAQQHPDAVVLTVSNEYDDSTANDRSSGHGLRIVADRLRTFYGGGGKMMVNRGDGRFEVRLRLPRIDKTEQKVGMR